MADAPQKPKASEPDPPSLWPGVGRLLLGLSILGLGGYVVARGGTFVRQLPAAPRIGDVTILDDSRRDTCGPPAINGRPIPVTMVYSDDKKSWIDEASNRFSKVCPNIQVTTTPMGDIESADAILDGEVEPTIWSPADDLVLRYLDFRWRERFGPPPFDITQQTSLAKSPLLMLIWEDRLRVVDAIVAQRPLGEGPWVDFMCSGVPREPQGLEGMALEDKVPGTWVDWYNPVTPSKVAGRLPPAPKKARTTTVVSEVPTYVAPFPTIDQIKKWGRVKFLRTSPTRAASGLAALYLMAYDYVLPPAKRPPELKVEIRAARVLMKKEGGVVRSERLAGDFARAFAERRGALKRWLERCEAGLESAPPSTELLTNTLFESGPSRYDAAVTSEHLTFPIFRRIDQYADVLAEVRVVYPQPTLLNEHPAVLFTAKGDVTAEQQQAAEKWIKFLLSTEMQELAVTLGFRPGNPAMSIRSFDSNENPFMRFRRYGVEIDLLTIEPPRLDGKVVNDLIRTWEDATGRN